MKNKKTRIKVQFDKETWKALKKYAKSHRQTLEKAASSILEKHTKLNIQITKDGKLGIVYPYSAPPNSIHVHRDIPPLVVPMTATLNRWGRIRAWLRGLPCKQCKGKWNISCKGVVCKVEIADIDALTNKQVKLRELLPRRAIKDFDWNKQRANPLSDPDQDAQ